MTDETRQSPTETVSHERPESCPTCNRYTTAGLQQLAIQCRSRPIYGTDLTRPLSALIADIRSQMVESRGQLGDIGSGFTGWREDLANVEGLLTCGLVALHHTMERMKEHERLYAEQLNTLQRPEGGRP
jgi:hypothetical protein